MSGFTVNTETLRVERVVSDFRHEADVRCLHEAPASAGQLAGVTVDILDPSWEVFDGAGLACATLRVWAYCLSGGEVRAVSWDDGFRAFVPIPGLRKGMRIEARFRVEETNSEIGRSDGMIAVTAVVSCEAVVVETVVLQVVTGIAPPQPAAAEAAPITRPLLRLVYALTGRLRRRPARAALADTLPRGRQPP